MVTIDVHDVIANETHGWFYEMFGYKGVFSLETVKQIFADNQTKKDFYFNFHCDGGEVAEGLAIYDAMRRSGKRIHCNVEGNCHSMAVTLLLAAPAENRTANPNAQFLIHEVQGGAAGSTSAMEAAVDEQRKLQNAILDIYADRTGQDRTELEALMKEEKTHTAAEMLDLGFISAINAYNTNLKPLNMNILDRLKALVTECEAEPANVAPATPETPDVRDQQIADLNARIDTLTADAAAAQTAAEAANARIAELEAAVADRDANIATLTTERDSAISEAADLKERLTRSNYAPGERQTPKTATDQAGESAEDIKAAVREKLKH